jgi:hypothetical protein
MRLLKAIYSSLLVLVFQLGALNAETAVNNANVPTKPAVTVHDVKFLQTKLGNQVNFSNRMQIEVGANNNPDPKAPNKKWVDKVKVTVTQIYKTDSKKFEDWNYYRASATILTLEVGASNSRSVLFYLPSDIVKRDRLSKEPDYYFVQLEVAGKEEPLFDAKGVVVPEQARGIHKDLLLKSNFDPAKEAADRGVLNNPGVLRPQYLLSYFDTKGWVPESPEFIREDAPSR